MSLNYSIDDKINTLRKSYDDIYRYDSSLFLEFLKEEGLPLDKRTKILELTQSPYNSISRLLPENDTFLLSTKVTAKELTTYGIKGAYGYIDRRGIVMPRTMINDEIFLGPNKKYNPNKGYAHKSINRYDQVISNGIPESLELARHNKNYYIGFCTEEAAIAKKNLEELKRLKALLLEYTGEDYLIKKEAQEGKTLVLLRKKKTRRNK